MLKTRFYTYYLIVALVALVVFLIPAPVTVVKSQSVKSNSLNSILRAKNVYNPTFYLIPPQGTSLGGGVGIHGGDKQEFGANWTYGCVGLTNADIEEFYDYIKIGTMVVIEA